MAFAQGSGTTNMKAAGPDPNLIQSLGQRFTCDNQLVNFTAGSTFMNVTLSGLKYNNVTMNPSDGATANNGYIIFTSDAGVPLSTNDNLQYSDGPIYTSNAIATMLEKDIVNGYGSVNVPFLYKDNKYSKAKNGSTLANYPFLYLSSIGDSVSLNYLSLCEFNLPVTCDSIRYDTQPDNSLVITVNNFNFGYQPVVSPNLIKISTYGDSQTEITQSTDYFSSSCTFTGAPGTTYIAKYSENDILSSNSIIIPPHTTVTEQFVVKDLILSDVNNFEKTIYISGIDYLNVDGNTIFEKGNTGRVNITIDDFPDFSYSFICSQTNNSVTIPLKGYTLQSSYIIFAGWGNFTIKPSVKINLSLEGYSGQYHISRNYNTFANQNKISCFLENQSFSKKDNTSTIGVSFSNFDVKDSYGQSVFNPEYKNLIRDPSRTTFPIISLGSPVKTEKILLASLSGSTLINVGDSTQFNIKSNLAHSVFLEGTTLNVKWGGTGGPAEYTGNIVSATEKTVISTCTYVDTQFTFPEVSVTYTNVYVLDGYYVDLADYNGLTGYIALSVTTSDNTNTYELARTPYVYGNYSYSLIGGTTYSLGTTINSNCNIQLHYYPGVTLQYNNYLIDHDYKIDLSKIDVLPRSYEINMNNVLFGPTLGDVTIIPTPDILIFDGVTGTTATIKENTYFLNVSY